MSNRTIRLLNSLKLLAQVPDGWLSRSPAAGEPGNPPHANPTLDDTARYLRHAFPLADDDSIAALAEVCAPLSLPAGNPVVIRGEAADAIYIVVAGLCAADAPAEGGPDGSPGRWGAGDVIGDIGCITGADQTATIRALRNSELLRVSKTDLQTAAARCPGVLLALCSTVVERLQRAPAAAASAFKSRTFCLVPADPTIDLAPIIESFADTLRGFGTVTAVSAETTAGRPLALSEIERRFDFVVLPADAAPTPWTRFCLRQCDRIVLVANGEAEPSRTEALGRNGANVPSNTPVSLVLLWRDMVLPRRTAAWLRSVNPVGHHHIRSPRDLPRASRLIAGRGCALVFSGGGAKALAHLGVIDALRQHDIPIDAVGGTSIGAIVAAVFALEWDHGSTVRSLAMAFSSRRFSDFALSRTALYSERVFTRTLGHCFGELEIEDTPVPFFCVSTNLTQGVSTVHRTGSLVTWLRAASSVPGICPPIMHQNVVYVDGGVLNNMPTDAARQFGAATVLGVDVGSCLDGPARSDAAANMPTILDLLWRVGTIGSDTAANRPPRDGEVILRPEVADIRLFEWDAHAKAIAAGYQTALDHLDEIKAALGRKL